MSGKLIVISGPSGTGKTSICNALLERLPNAIWSVSVTTRPKRGGELSHRLVYVLCPSVPTESIEGKLTTRILHKARALKTDEIPFSIEEGRWVLHTFITLPESAESGAYALDVRFRSKKGNLIATAPFVIE